MTDQQIDEFLEMLAKSPTSARDMVRGLFAKAAPAEPFGYFRAEPFGWTDCAATDEGAIALYERPAAPAVPNVLKRGYGRLIQAAADLALQQFMPSDIVDDYPSKTISAAKVAKMMTQPRDRLRLLSIEVSEGAKQMLAAAPAAPSQPAVPQGWKSVLIPTEWTIGPNLFKDWCSQWFGPDSDDEYLMHAAHALLGLAAAPAAPSQEPDVPQGFKPVGYLRSDEFDGHVFEPIDGTWPFDELLFSLSISPEPVQEVTLTDEAVNAAAKVLAERFDYPWEHMPEEGRKNMRVQARAVVIAALREKGGK